MTHWFPGAVSCVEYDQASPGWVVDMKVENKDVVSENVLFHQDLI